MASLPAGHQLVVREAGDKGATFAQAKPPAGKDIEVTVVVQFDTPTPAEANRVHVTLMCDGGVVRSSQTNKYRSCTGVQSESKPMFEDGRIKLLAFSSEQTERGPELVLALEKAP
jgi:hypothetical protein